MHRSRWPQGRWQSTASSQSTSKSTSMEPLSVGIRSRFWLGSRHRDSLKGLDAQTPATAASRYLLWPWWVVAGGDGERETEREREALCVWQRPWRREEGGRGGWMEGREGELRAEAGSTAQHSHSPPHLSPSIDLSRAMLVGGDRLAAPLLTPSTSPTPPISHSTYPTLTPSPAAQHCRSSTCLCVHLAYPQPSSLPSSPPLSLVPVGLLVLPLRVSLLLAPS